MNGKEVARITLSDTKEITVYSDGNHHIFLTLPIPEKTKGNHIILTDKQALVLIERVQQFDKVMAEVRNGNTVKAYGTISQPIPIYSPNETLLYVDASCAGSVEKTTCVIRFADPMRGAGLSHMNSLHFTENQIHELQTALQDAMRANSDIRQRVARLKSIISASGL
jgi:hypothetical protein